MWDSCRVNNEVRCLLQSPSPWKGGSLHAELPGFGEMTGIICLFISVLHSSAVIPTSYGGIFVHRYCSN